MAIHPKRTKSAFIQLRVTPGDREAIRAMAEGAGLGLTEFILSRVWGPAEVSVGAVPVRDELGERGLAGGSVEGVAPRKFNASRPAWYQIVCKTDWGLMLMEDVSTHQVWKVKNGVGQEYGSVAEGRAAFEAEAGE